MRFPPKLVLFLPAATDIQEYHVYDHPIIPVNLGMSESFCDPYQKDITIALRIGF